MITGLIVSMCSIMSLIPEVVWRDAKAHEKAFFPHLWMFFKGLGTTDWGVDGEVMKKYFSKTFDPEIKEPWVSDLIEKWVNETKPA